MTCTCRIVESLAGPYIKQCDLHSAAEAMLQALRSDAGFIRRFLEQLERRDMKDERGHVVNGFAGAFIPDWELRQRLADIEGALSGIAAAEPKGEAGKEQA